MGGYGGASGRVKGKWYYDTGGHMVKDKDAIKVAEHYINEGKYVAFLQEKQGQSRDDLSVEGHHIEVKRLTTMNPDNVEKKIKHAFVQIHGDDSCYSVGAHCEGKVVILSNHSSSTPENDIYDVIKKGFLSAQHKGYVTGRLELWINGKIYRLNIGGNFMASLKCSHCGYNIHYHDEPNGIEYTAISQKLWYTFADTDKPIIRYLLEDDGDFLFIWRCPECGCIHAFNGYHSQLKQAYIPCGHTCELASARKYIVFIDYLFENVADEGLSAKQFAEKNNYDNTHFFYAMIGENGVTVYEDEACTKALRNYIAIETPTDE